MTESIVKAHGWRKFSGQGELSLGGGGGVDALDLFLLGNNVGRIVIDSFEMQCDAGTSLTLTFTGPLTHLQTLKTIGPGATAEAQGQGVAIAYYDANVNITAYLVGAGASAGYVRVAGKVV